LNRFHKYGTENYVYNRRVISLDNNTYASLSRQAAAEGIVLLKNDGNVLPLKSGTKAACFGRSQFNYYKSGTGSGGLVNAPYVVSVLDALKASPELTVDRPILDLYHAWIEKNPYDNGDNWVQPRCQKEMPLDDSAVAAAAVRCDTAIVTIGRTAGEERDNLPGAGGYSLTKEEEAMLKTVCTHFKNTVVLLNVGSIIDMKWVSEYAPSAVVYIWQGGQEGGNAAADVLLGRISPSGRLPDTIALDISDYPSTKNFGDDKENIYAEDIFVGYRYFETFAKDRVLYPFGFGLSYTTFSYETVGFSVSASGIEADVCVTNTGSCTAKEVVQLYCEQPCGLLGKSKRVLCGFEKTSTLKPGDRELVHLHCDNYSVSSFDDTGRTGYPYSWVMETGEYAFFAGNSVRCTHKLGSFTIEETTLIKQLGSAQAPVKAFERLVNSGGSPAYETVPVRDYDLWQRIVNNRPAAMVDSATGEITFGDVREGRATLEDFISRLPAEQLCVLVRGEGMNSPKVTPGTGGAFGGLSPYLQKLGVPIACCTDGPSGLRLDSGAKAFSLPNGTCLAASFNRKLSASLFEYTALEMRRNRIDVLLGPGLNLHRNPLNGRNFEYFSEDPYLTGIMAEAQLEGLRRHGVTGTIKHFEGNNQEHERRRVNGVISQRAQRELYLKSFELASRGGYAKCIMSTYGPVNGLWTAGSYDLLTTILRKEWGYEGLVMSDWWADGNEEGGEPSRKEIAAMVRSQNDLYMVNEDAENNSNNDNLMSSLGTEKLTLAELQRAAANILRVLLELPTMDILSGSEAPVYSELRNESMPDVIKSHILID